MVGRHNRALCSVAVVCALPATLALPASAARISIGTGTATRNYTAHITATTGLYSKMTGRQEIVVVVTQANKALGPGEMSDYDLAITLRGLPCRSGGHGHPPHNCLRLSGAIRTTATEQHQSPDAAATMILAASSAHITHVGAIQASGDLEGTGYLHGFGKRTIYLTLHGPRGAISLVGQGPRVPPFTSP